MVNPRLKSYNKPFMLALLIGTITGTFTLFGMAMHYIANILVLGNAMSWAAVREGQPLSGCMHYAESSVVRSTTVDGVQTQIVATEMCSFEKGREAENLLWADDETGQIQEVAWCADEYKDNDAAVALPCSGLMVLVLQTDGGYYTSFGVAVGQWGIIELFVTGCIVFPLLACSCIKTGKDSDQALTIKEWVKGWSDLKDTVGGENAAEQIGV